jgi:ribosomal protein S18 acetylase RimI-like enzyme
MSLSFKLAGTCDAELLSHPADQLLDGRVNPALLAEFLADPRHHIVVAHEDGIVVGIVSAVDYVHPDKPRQLWINEVAVAPSYRSAGVASRMMRIMLEHGRNIQCTEAWVMTDAENLSANRLYRSVAMKGEAKPRMQIIYSFDLT